MIPKVKAMTFSWPFFFNSLVENSPANLWIHNMLHSSYCMYSVLYSLRYCSVIHSDNQMKINNSTFPLLKSSNIYSNWKLLNMTDWHFSIFPVMSHFPFHLTFYFFLDFLKLYTRTDEDMYIYLSISILDMVDIV